MRAVTQRMIDALLCGNAKRVSRNTDVTADGEVLLFGNRIAWFDNERIYVSSCASRTTMTKERINELLIAFASAGLGQHRGQWFVEDYDSSFGSWSNRRDFVDGMSFAIVDTTE